jgi:membrane fusion protein (multidrug efflux system)
MTFKHVQNMKTYFAIIGAALFLIGCAAPENRDLAKLKEQRDSLKTETSRIGAEIMKIDDKIAELSDEFSLPQVTALKVVSSDFDHFFTVQGNIETDLNAQVFPELQGVITAIYVSEGQSVSKGQRLMALDTELIRKNITEVETQYDFAVEVFERQKRLWDQNIGSEIQFLEAETNKTRLENTLSTLQKQVSMGTVNAPFAGTIDGITPKVGEMASPAVPVARIISLNNMYVTADVSENYLSEISLGMSAQVIVPGIDTVASTINRVGRFINPENRTFEIALDLTQDARFRPNMFASLRINDMHLDSVTVIPNAMVQQDSKGNEFVYLLNGKGATYEVEKRIVTLGGSYGDDTYISGGLKPGDLIVDKGARRVVSGETVELSEMNAISTK